MTKLHGLGVVEAAAAIRKGELTAEQLSSALLARAHAQRQLNAFVTLDANSVLEVGPRRRCASEGGQAAGGVARRADRAQRQHQHRSLSDHRRYAGPAQPPAEAERAGGAGPYQRRRDRVRQAGDA